MTSSVMTMSCCTQQKRCFTVILQRHFELDNSSFMLFCEVFFTHASCHSKIMTYFEFSSWLTCLFWASLRYLFICWGTMSPAVTVTARTVITVIQWICSLFSSLGTQMTNLGMHIFISNGDVTAQMCNIYRPNYTFFVIFKNLIIQVCRWKQVTIKAFF